MRQYQPLWEQLKKTGSLYLEQPRPTHQKIIAAITKESSNDLGFRFHCIEQDKSYYVSGAQVGDILFLSLVYKHGDIPPEFIIGPDRVKKRDNWRTPYIQRAISKEEKEKLMKELE